LRYIARFSASFRAEMAARLTCINFTGEPGDIDPQ
jgi:hypothetical protein